MFARVKPMNVSKLSDARLHALRCASDDMHATLFEAQGDGALGLVGLDAELGRLRGVILDEIRRRQDARHLSDLLKQEGPDGPFDRRA